MASRSGLVKMTEYTPFQHMLVWHALRYPLWLAQDIYKLIYQSALGCEHSAPDRARAQAALERELTTLPAGTTAEALTEPLDENGSIVRLHLRSLMRMQLSPVVLLDAFLQTASQYEGSLDLLEEYARQAVEVAADLMLASNPRTLGDFFQHMKEIKYPPVHHSGVYRRAYAPAYRVVASCYLPSNWRSF